MADRDPHDPLGRKEKDRSWRLYAAGFFALLALILVLQNSEEVDFNFFFAEVQTPLFFGLIIAFILGALTGWLVPKVRGGGHRHDRDEK